MNTNPLQRRRLESRWDAVLDEAREVAGERGVQAIQKAREQYEDNEEEFLTNLEEVIRAGGFIELLRDLVSNLCSLM